MGGFQMKRNKLFKLLAMGLCASMLLAGCGGTKDEPQKKDDAAQTSQSDTEPLSFKITTVYFGDTSPENTKIQQEWIKLCEEKMGRELDITFEYIHTGDYTEKLQVINAGGDLPDILTCYEVVKAYGHTGVVIEHNQVKSIGGDGITPMYCFRPLVQYNVAENIATEINDEMYTEAGERGGKTAAAIWPWKCKDALFQYNKAYHTCENQDGQAWDADSGDGTIYQYNYSYRNGGGCVMFCLQESIHNTFRYNISVFDQSGIINPTKNPDAHIYGNIFIVAEGVPFIRDNMSGGHMLVEENLIYYTGEQPVKGDWFHQTEYAKYHKNVYYNYADHPENDKEPILRNKEDSILKEFLRILGNPVTERENNEKD